uniref:Secreted protein n=1 Tax=Haemonchus contortus TaxID=6289 RepID=A0A7I4Z0V9_HAECO
MERLLLPFLVIGVIAARQAYVSPPKDIGFGNSRVIKHYASMLGTLDTVRARKSSGHLQYYFTLYNADCNKVISWISDVVDGDPKNFYPDVVQCIPNALLNIQ